MPLSDVLVRRAPVLAAYEGQRQSNEMRGPQELQQALTLSGLLEQQRQRQMQMQDEKALRGVMQQTGGDPQKAIQALLSHGSPKAIELASKLKGLVHTGLEGMPDIVKLTTLEKQARDAGNVPMADNIAAMIRKNTQTEGAAGQEDRQTLLEARKAYMQGTATEDQLAKATLIYDNLTAPKMVNGNLIQTPLPKEYDPRQRFGLPSQNDAMKQITANTAAGKGGTTLTVDPYTQPSQQGAAPQPSAPAQVSARPAPVVTEVPKTNPLTDVAKANADLAAGRITPEQHAAVVGVKTGEGPGRMDDAAIAAAAARYAIDGTMPPNLGRGTQGVVNTSLILKKAAEDAAANGMTPEASRLQQIANKASAGALLQLVKQKNLVMAFKNTAVKNADLVVSESEKVDRLGTPAIDRWLLAGKKNILGDPAVARLDAAMRTFVNEYARVTTTVTGGGITSDTARKEIETLLQSKNTKEQVREVIDLMKTEMDNRRLGYEEQERALKGSITSGVPSVPAAAPNAAQSSVPSGTKEGTESLSKSGKPMIFRNGQWEYK